MNRCTESATQYTRTLSYCWSRLLIWATTMTKMSLSFYAQHAFVDIEWLFLANKCSLQRVIGLIKASGSCFPISAISALRLLSDALLSP